MKAGKTGKALRKPTGYVKRNEEQREYDIAFCSNLFLRGYSYREIADALNKDLAKRGIDYTISHVMVHYDMKQVLIEWKRQRMDNIDDYVSQALAKLDRMESELWNAWERSKHHEKTKTRSSRRGDNVDLEDDKTKRYGDYGYLEKTNEHLSGDARFFDLILKVEQRRAKLLGYDAPIKVDIPGLTKPDVKDDDKYNVKAIPESLLFSVVDALQDGKYKETVAQ